MLQNTIKIKNEKLRDLNITVDYLKQKIMHNLKDIRINIDKLC